MSAQDVHTEIIEPMQRAFLPPRAMPEEQQISLLREYSDALSGYERDDLKASWRTVRDSHVGRAWPAIATFVHAAREALRERGAGLARSPFSKSDRGAEWAVWERVRRSEMARVAVREGCAWALRCAVLNDGKIPEQIDIRQLIMAHKSAGELAEAIRTNTPIYRKTAKYQGREYVFDDTRADMALRMYETIQVREAETQDEIRRAQAVAA